MIGFADKLRLLTVLMEDLKVIKELGIKACRECSFSCGGQYFAAVNGTTISIYNTYTAENVGNLRGHNGRVRSIFWSPDDTKLISAGMDGAVYEWRLKDFKREKEHVLKGCNYSSVLATPDCKTLYATGSDKRIKEYEDSLGTGTQITKEIDAGTNLTQMVLLSGAKALFGATEGGCIRTYKYPLSGEFQEFKSHNASISRLKNTWDESLLISASEDGSIFVWDVRDRDAKAAAKREQERIEFAVEVLVTRSELDEKKARMTELEQQVAELTMQTEYQLRLKDLHLQERIKELTDKYTAEQESDRQKFDALLNEKNDMEMEYEEKLKAAEERSQVQLATLDAQYQAKIMAEVERYQALLQEKELLNERWDEQNSLLVESHERVIAELTEDYEAKLAEEALRIEALQAEKAELEREFEEIKRQLEEDADREIEETKEKYETKLQGERDSSLRLKGENGIMRKKFNALQKDIEAQKEEIKQLFEQKKEFYATIASLEKDIGSLKREIRERDETIGDKERRIYDLKKKNQELEKFKFVLDYKIKELKKQIEPREAEISDMKEQIKEMDGELERYHRTNAGLDLTIGSLRQKQAGLASEVLSQRTSKQDATNMLVRLQGDIAEVAAFIQEPQALKEKVKALYQKYSGEACLKREEDGDVGREGARQREYLEKTVDSLKRKLAKDSELHRTDNLRIMQENTALIKEINELRREIKTLKAGMKPGMMGVGTIGKGTGGALAAADTEAQRREMEIQRDLIQRLREDLVVKEQRIKTLEGMVVPRPMSRERLPPMDVVV
uniref:Cilia- and flagella-associated protein 57 n=1 Tax=Polytomella parva TaxID=51329 RepID=A0A7S0YIJ8_9CHLO